MPQPDSVLRARLVVGAPQPTLKLTLEDAVRTFFRGVADAQTDAARRATDVSRSSYKRIRPIAPSRPGRAQESMKSFISWKAVPKSPNIVLDVPRLDQNAPHWIIQEIGTGQRANMRRGGVTRAPGRPSGPSVRTVKSQKGRKISRGLVWSSGGRYAPPRQGSAGQQIALASRVTGVPYQRRSIVIRQEITGQHFVQKGAEAGFREYQTSVLAAARQAFRNTGAS